jgi:hypothetical protein
MSTVDSTPPTQPGASGYQTPPQVPLSERINALALVAFIGSFFVSLLGIIAGHIALKQITRSGERGRGFALAGTIIGYVSFVLTAIIVAVVIAAVISAGSLTTRLEKIGGSQASSNSAYSDQFCHDLIGIAKSAQAASKDPNLRQSLTDAYAAVAKDPSPHQKDYQAMAALLADPSGATSAQVTSVTADLAKAAQADALACGSRLK